MYSIKEMFYTLQGEGAQAGRAAVFLRFAGCNLWTGREADRPKAVCQFCDTDFVGTDGENGGKFKEATDLAAAVFKLWDEGHKFGVGAPLVVCTGGEPLLQLDSPLIRALQALEIEVAVETNGTIEAPAGIDWICVSPKAGSTIKQIAGDELKLVYPQAENEPEQFTQLDFDHFFLQPRDDGNEEANQRNREAVVAYCMENPQWRVSLQTHKLLNIK